MAAIYNIGCNGTAPIEQGATYTLAITAGAGDLPMDLTGYSVRAQLRTAYAAVDHTDFDALIEAPATGGKVTLKLSAEATSALAPTSYVYDCELTAPDGTVIRLIEGRAYVTPEVTK